MKDTTAIGLHQLIDYYNYVIQGVDADAFKLAAKGERAYGGVIRGVKGKLQEYITERLIEIAWVDELAQAKDRLRINSTKLHIPINREYVHNLPPQLKYHN